MEHLGTECVSQPGDAALVEQRGRAAPCDLGKICISCATALRTTYLAPSRTPRTRTISAGVQIRCIRSPGWERKQGDSYNSAFREVECQHKGG
jgi:hypothetical protein